MKRLMILTIVLMTLSHAYGENPCGIMTPQNSGQWGDGFIWFSLTKKIPVYNKPHGDKVGTLTRDKYGALTFEKVDSQKVFEINQNDLVWVGHVSVTLLKVYQVKSDFCNVFVQSEGSGLWINFKENDKEIQFLTYRTFLLTPQKAPVELQELVKNVNIGVNLITTCLNLRKENDNNSEIIKCIANNKIEQSEHTNLKILETSGDWANVEVTVYEYDSENDESGEGCSFRQKEKMTGWVEAINEKGFPTIWHSITAY